MNIKVKDLMSGRVVLARPHDTVERIRGVLKRNRIHAIPVVDSTCAPAGMVSTADLADDLKPGTPVSGIMTEKVFVVPQYEDVAIAARMMRKHRIHHLVVTHEKQVVGILSSLDLLKLVENHRFVMKGPPTVSSRKSAKRTHEGAS